MVEASRQEKRVTAQMNTKLPIESDDLLALLPHRQPFIFVDRVRELELGKRILAERLLRPEEPYFAGHFPGRAIMPGVLVCEALAQTCGLLLGLSDEVKGEARIDRPRMFHLAGNSMKYKHIAVPGDTLELRAKVDGQHGGLFRFSVEALAGVNLVASGSITLAAVNELL
jgi:3-hydroxyacyl-[acyl-carrier-protein] dehydratase